MPARRVLLTQSALLERLPRRDASAASCARCRCGRHRGAAQQRPRHRPRPATPRLRHLHLRLHRNAEGRRASHAVCTIVELCACRTLSVLTPDDVVLQSTPFSFDAVGLRDLLRRSTGRRWSSVPAARPRSGRLAATIRTQDVTTLHFVPLYAAAVLRMKAPHISLYRRLICGGEAALVGRCADRVSQLCPAFDSINLYGPTEATIDVTMLLRVSDGIATVLFPLAGRSGTRGCTCWTAVCSLCRRG